MRHGLSRFKRGCRCRVCSDAMLAQMRKGRLIDKEAESWTKGEIEHVRDESAS